MRLYSIAFVIPTFSPDPETGEFRQVLTWKLPAALQRKLAKVHKAYRLVTGTLPARCEIDSEGTIRDFA